MKLSDLANPEYIKAVRDTFEVLSFASTPILAILAWKGLKQIRVTRDVARITARRESFRLATERCEQFASVILPASEAVDQVFEQKKFSQFQKIIVEENDKGISISWKDSRKWLDELSKNGDSVYRLANLLEGFALWFTCGIADENVAFRPCGSSFCGMVKQILPMLVMENKRNKTYSHTLRLYVAWRDKIKIEKNQAKQQELEMERKSLKVENIKPIGA